MHLCSNECVTRSRNISNGLQTGLHQQYMDWHAWSIHTCFSYSRLKSVRPTLEGWILHGLNTAPHSHMHDCCKKLKNVKLKNHGYVEVSWKPEPLFFYLILSIFSLRLFHWDPNDIVWLYLLTTACHVVTVCKVLHNSVVYDV